MHKLEEKYKCRIVINMEGSVTIHALIKDEGDQCFKEIQDTISSYLVVTKTISVSYLQARYFEAKEKFQLEAVKNKVEFTLVKDKINNYTIALKGTVNCVDTVMKMLQSYIAEAACTNLQYQTFTYQCLDNSECKSQIETFVLIPLSCKLQFEYFIKDNGGGQLDIDIFSQSAADFHTICSHMQVS